MAKRSFSFNEDRLVGLILLIAAVAYGLGAKRLLGLYADDPVGPAGFPFLIAAAGVGLSLWLFVKPSIEPPEAGRVPFLVWIYWAVFAAYAVLIPYLGFGLATLIFLVTAFLMLRTKYWQAIVIALITTAIVYGLFAKLLEVPLALGPWG